MLVPLRPFHPILTTDYFTLEQAPPCSGNSAPYYRLTGPDSVICCLLDQEDQFVMVRQYRPNLEIQTTETPAGGMEPGESPLQAMQREIAEETGLRCALLPLGETFSLMMNRTNIKDHLFFGMFPTPVAEFEPEQGIEMMRVPRLELFELAIRGDYIQLAGLGLLQVAGGVLQVDMWRSALAEIEEAFQQQPQVVW